MGVDLNYNPDDRLSQRQIDSVYARSIIPEGARLFAHAIQNIEEIEPRSQKEFFTLTHLSLRR